jgi:hypothetical protein
MVCLNARLRHRLETLVTVFTAQELDCECDGTFHKDAAWWLAQLATAYEKQTVGELRKSLAWAVKPDAKEPTNG